MAQAVKTVEYPFVTRLTNLATVTALAGTNFETFAAITVDIPETTSRTIRSAQLIITFRDAETTTARRFDGARVGIQVDAVSFDDLDLTGTGIANTGDHYGAHIIRDITSYLVTNFTSGSHTIGARIEVQTDVASNINNITAKLRITYEYSDAAATHVKTIRIPLEGNAGFLSTTANTNIQGSTGATQIPDLDAILPEASKSYKHIWFEVYADDGGAGGTDFNANYAIDGGTTDVRATLEQGLQTSVNFFDIWVQNSLDTTNPHNFQAWSSLASRFERFCVVMHVTYTFNPSTSTSIFNSVLIPINSDTRSIAGTSSTDQELFINELWIEEPSSIAIQQSGLLLFWQNGGAGNLTPAVEGEDAAGGSQGTTTSTYTGTSQVKSGYNTLCHRIDVAHGGTAITLDRGKNTLKLKIFASASNAVTAFGGYYIINYTSGKATAGVAAHNQTTFWKIDTMMEGTIAGAANREIATTNQRTPNIPQTSYFINAYGIELRANHSGTGIITVRDENESGEFEADGWLTKSSMGITHDAEFGEGIYISMDRKDLYKRYVNFPYDFQNIETARKDRIDANLTGQWSLTRVVTHHSITSSVGGTLSNSAGGTINLELHDTSSGELLMRGSRVGNGAYSITWFDNTRSIYVKAYETSSLKNVSAETTPATNIDISLLSAGGGGGGGKGHIFIG